MWEGIWVKLSMLVNVFLLLGCVQDEWVVCRIFQKTAGGKKSFLYSDNAARMHLLPPLLDHSPNPTITDEGNCTDCETCAGTDQSCFNCGTGSELIHHDNSVINNINNINNNNNNHKENNSTLAPLTWIVRPKMDNLPSNNNTTMLTTTAGMENMLHHHHHQQLQTPQNLQHNLHQTNAMKSYPLASYDLQQDKSFSSFPRMAGFNPQAYMQATCTTMPQQQQQGQGVATMRASLRPKTEPSLCDDGGEDEAQSRQRELCSDFASWAGNGNCDGGGLYHTDTLTGTTTESSCVLDQSSSQLSHEDVNLLRLKYGHLIPDVAVAPVDGLQELLWAY
jgi:hypothetical protein